MKIKIFNRHCYLSSVSINKSRPKWFCRKKCFENLKNTMDQKNCELFIIYDENKGSLDKHFVRFEKNIKIINSGYEADSFIKLLEYIISFDFDPETIIYIVEDDYLHVYNWCDILREGFNLGFDYITLYDHFDKYTNSYSNLNSKILISDSTHWRTTPSTTNTYATKFKNLKRDFDTHLKYSKNLYISLDHEKFIHLNKEGKYLGSPIPGASTHVETEWMSPIIKWENYA